MNTPHRKSDGLAVSLGALTLPNPVMNASGTGGYGTEEYSAPVLDRLGAFVTKGICVNGRPGNPPPRIAETPSGMLNAIGLENVGVEVFAEKHLPALVERNVRVVVNCFGETERDYVRVVEILDGLEGIDALELNVSCPNVKKGGIAFGQEPDVLHGLVKSLLGATGLPLWVKLAPESPDIMAVAQAAWEGGADALTVANTYRGMAIDVEKKRPRIAVGTGGLSGPAIRPLTLYRVWLVAGQSPVPVIGVGGIACARDAIEYLLAGATAVQIGTGAFYNPAVFDEVIEGIQGYLDVHGHKSVEEIIGAARPE